MDPELSAAIAALTRFDLDASRARLAQAVGAPAEVVGAIMRGEAEE